MKRIKKRFSIVTPIHLSGEDTRRKPLFQKCIESIKNQDYDKEKIEHIIVDDGSPIGLEIPDYPWIKVIRQDNLQRLTAYNTGFKAARGEIITLLDSDDGYESNYLSSVDRMYKEYPQYKMFNFGCKYIHADGGVALRAAFQPKEEAVGHEIFGGSKIVNGTFVFTRKIYKELGGFPPHHVKNIDCRELNYGGPRELWMTSPYDFSAYAQLEFPEIQQYFMEKHPDHPKHLVKELGNPFGQDYYLFYKYTRKHHSKPIDEHLYLVNPR